MNANAKIYDEGSRILNDKLYYFRQSSINLESRIFDSHMHPYYELCFILQGNGRLFIEGNEFLFAPYGLVMCKPTTFHQQSPNPNTFYDRIVAGRFNKIDKRLVEKAFDGGCYRQFAADSPVTDLLVKLDRYNSVYDEEDFVTVADAIFTEIFMLLIHSTPETTVPKSNGTTTAIIQFIEQNLCTIKSMDDIAKHLFISTSTLYHAFNENVKIPIMTYIRNKRLIRAKIMIDKGEKPNKVFEACGFNDYSSFFRAYKKYFGISPSEKSDSPD